MAPEGLAGDGGEATSDFEEDQNEDDPFSHNDHDSRSPLLGNYRSKFGADASYWAVSCYFAFSASVRVADTMGHFL